MTSLAKKTILICSFSLLAAALVTLALLDYYKIPLIEPPTADSMLKGILMRALGSVCLIMFIFNLRFHRVLFSRPTLIGLALIIPALIVALNNFPFIDFFIGNLTLTSPELIWLFALECLAVGLFEELLFRGFLFPLLLEKKTTKKGVLLAVLISSAAFGLMHLINLFAGAGFGGVVMQIGYSFLIGAMMCFVLLATNNIIFCVLLHALFNFCGLIFPSLGGGAFWSIGTIILTAVIAAGAVAFMVIVFFNKKFTPEKKLPLLFKS